jgi:hypothetical protein
MLFEQARIYYAPLKPDRSEFSRTRGSTPHKVSSYLNFLLGHLAEGICKDLLEIGG